MQPVAVPFHAVTLGDADLSPDLVSVPMSYVSFSFTDPDDPTKTANCVVVRTPYLAQYILGHQTTPMEGEEPTDDHIPVPMDTFIVVRAYPDEGVNPHLPVWVYGGRNTVFTPITTFTDDDPPEEIPVFDSDGYPTFTKVESGLDGPNLSGSGVQLFPIVNASSIYAKVAMNSPWGERGYFVEFYGNFTSEGLEQPYRTTVGFEDTIKRPSVVWCGHDPVPINISNLTKCGVIRSHLGGALHVATFGSSQSASIKLVKGRIERRSRKLTYESILVPSFYDDAGAEIGPEPGGLETGMYVRGDRDGAGHGNGGNGEAAQIAVIDQVDDAGLSYVKLSTDFDKIGEGKVMFCAELQVNGCYARFYDNLVTCNDTRGVATPVTTGGGVPLYVMDSPDPPATLADAAANGYTPTLDYSFNPMGDLIPAPNGMGGFLVTPPVFSGTYTYKNPVAKKQKVVWGIYNEFTGLWTPGEEIIGEVSEVINATGFRIVLTEEQRAEKIEETFHGKTRKVRRWHAAPTCWYGIFWAHDGAIKVEGGDGDVNTGDNGIAPDPDDGFRSEVS